MQEIEVINAKQIRNVKLFLPVDVVCAKEFADTSEKSVEDINCIPNDLMGLDIGPKSSAIFRDCILSSKSILWNGPMGVFEFSNYEEGTKQIAFAVAESTQKNKAFSVVGGGDSVSAISKFGLENQISFISTGGGAMLEFIENGSLPGIDAIEKSANLKV
jgi:phosphoglycerate kinase